MSLAIVIFFYITFFASIAFFDIAFLASIAFFASIVFLTSVVFFDITFLDIIITRRIRRVGSGWFGGGRLGSRGRLGTRWRLGSKWLRSRWFGSINIIKFFIFLFVKFEYLIGEYTLDSYC